MINMTNNVRRINRILTWFWSLVLLAPLISWGLVSAVCVFNGATTDLLPVSDYIVKFIGFNPAVAWLDNIWTALFSANGLMPFTSAAVVSLPIINYLLFWSVVRVFISVFIWIPCFCTKLIERWFE